MSYITAVYDAYDDMIDDCYTEIMVFGVGRSPSVVFKRVDPIMYEMGLAEWLDDLETEGNWCSLCEEFTPSHSPLTSTCYCDKEEE
tara:strand:- start:736 stop:993 length:258 start_codon:yes stop_codon:yes gene_type:complete